MTKQKSERSRGSDKIRLLINYEHVAYVLKTRRELCIGEQVRAA